MRRLFGGPALAMVLVACSSSPSTGDPPTSTAATTPLQVAIVNYELIAEMQNRFVVGLVLPDNRLVAYGSVQMRFTSLDENGQPAGGTSDVVRGTYLPLPGTEPGDANAAPQAIAPATVRGVYELEGARFLEAGAWAVEVAARIEGVGVAQGSATFEVLQEPGTPGIGERAPRSDNPVIGDPVPAGELDSRARDGGAIPDEALHRVSIAEAIERVRPAVVVFSTPVYCVSRFCGPVTDMVAELQQRFSDRAEFIHIEIWKDFEANVITETATEWLYRDGTLQEPWLFIIDERGRIAARWDNIFTAPEVEDGLTEVLGS